MMRPGSSLLTIGVLFTVTTSGPAVAGECLDEFTEQLTHLEKSIRKRPFALHEKAWYCLGAYYTRLGGGGNRWAGPRAARKIKQRRGSRNSKRVARICSAVIRHGKPQDRAAAVKLAAAWGVTTLAGEDIFTQQLRYLPCGLDPKQLAVLGGPQSVKRLMERFGRTQTCEARWSAREGRMLPRLRPFPRGWQKNRWRYKAYNEAKVAVLNALWHIAMPQSRGFLEGLIKSDPSPLVRERAQKVLDHLSGKS